MSENRASRRAVAAAAAGLVDPVHRRGRVHVRQHLAHHAQPGAAERLVHPLLDAHADGAAGEAEMLQRARRHPLVQRLEVEADIAVLAVAVGHLHQAALVAEIADLLQRRGTRRRRVLRQALLGEVQLVGAVDQLHHPVEVAFQVVLDGDADVAAAQEADVVAGAVCSSCFLRSSSLYWASRVSPASSLPWKRGCAAMLGDEGLVGDDDAGHGGGHLGAVVGVVVDEHHGGRAQARPPPPWRRRGRPWVTSRSTGR